MTWTGVMNRAETWQITVQPWLNSARISVRMTRATYNRHGRQRWEEVQSHHVAPSLLEAEIQATADLVMVFYERWRAAGEEDAQRDGDLDR